MATAVTERFSHHGSFVEPGWEVAATRHFSVVCFTSPGDDEALLAAVNASGEAFLSHAVIGGRYVLRLAVGTMLTTAEDIDRTWECLRALSDAHGG